MIELVFPGPLQGRSSTVLHRFSRRIGVCANTLKPDFFLASYGMAEAMPFPKTLDPTSS